MRNRLAATVVIAECTRFARQARYQKITLWIQRELHAARPLYDTAGLVRVNEAPHTSFGRDDRVAAPWEVML